MEIKNALLPGYRQNYQRDVAKIKKWAEETLERSDLDPSATMRTRRALKGLEAAITDSDISSAIVHARDLGTASILIDLLGTDSPLAWGHWMIGKPHNEPNITGFNRNRSQLAELARDIALEIWDQDEEQILRIKDVAEVVEGVFLHVFDGSHLEAHASYQPETFRAWIRKIPVGQRPEYSSARGSRSKSDEKTAESRKRLILECYRRKYK